MPRMPMSQCTISSGGIVVKVIQSFSTSFSTWKSLSKGAPQGSVLDSLLLNIFMNDFFHSFINDLGGELHMKNFNCIAMSLSKSTLKIILPYALYIANHLCISAAFIKWLNLSQKFPKHAK